ncbi:MAG: molybdopterin-dependent oxidoreductase [Oscillospiraceae bacterium]|jgi:hypothetical protein|nr:molybdopterin-dependent oxidoreductase [Oscillospiraceae bacterium]
MKKKSTIIVAAVLAALALGVAVLAVLNGKNAAAKQKLQSDAVFLIVAHGAEYRVSMEELQAMGPVAFEANYKKSGKAAETRAFTGVPFADVLRAKRIDTDGLKSAAFAAADGYASALPIEDALDGSNCYIAVSMNGEPLGTLESGGSGPFRMVMAHDPFSQRWCSFLTDVTLQ